MHGAADEGPVLAPMEEDGYTSPTFDLPSESDGDEAAPPMKRQKKGPDSMKRARVESTLEDEEELALRMLRGI